MVNWIKSVKNFEGYFFDFVGLKTLCATIAIFPPTNLDQPLQDGLMLPHVLHFYVPCL